MIAPWLVYSCAIGLIIVAIALLLEVIARWRPFPARWIWFMAILAIVTVPVALNFAMRTARHPEHGAPGQWIAMGAVPGAVTPAHHVSLDTPLLAIWGVASLLMFTRVLAGAALLGHRRRSWESVELDGRSVLLTDDLGPAVVGWGRLDTVVPRWALALDPPSREMMLAHESEHARSGDPYLRTAAIAALVLMPWNPAIWYAMRQLRLAVEIDCDQRLLAGGIDAHRYASFLLAIGERMAAPPFAWVTALAGPRSSLESRILAMTSPFRPRNPRMVAAALTAGIALLVVVACEGPVPASVLPPAESAKAGQRAVPALSLIRSDTFVMTCDKGCSRRGPITGVVRQSMQMPIVALRTLSDLDQVRVDTVLRQCGPQYVCQAKVERIDTMVVLRPLVANADDEIPTRDDSAPPRQESRTIGVEEWTCRDQGSGCKASGHAPHVKLITQGGSGYSRMGEVGSDTAACGAASGPIPQSLDQWLARRSVEFWKRGC